MEQCARWIGSFAVLLLLAGCSGSSQDTQAPATAPSPPATPAPPEPAPAPPPLTQTPAAPAPTEPVPAEPPPAAPAPSAPPEPEPAPPDEPEAPEPAPPPGSRPLVVLYGMDADSTLNGSAMDDGVVPALRAAGYPLMSLDLPCHGAQATSASPLYCWRTTIERGDFDIFNRFCRAISAELDRIGATNVVGVGQSRGGYIGAVCAAYDPRFTKLIMLKPVTDLQRLTEFDGYRVDQSLFGLGQYRTALRRIPVSIIIGGDDTRVGTDAAQAFAELVGAEIEIAPSPGHGLPRNGYTAAWVLARVEK